MKLKSNLHKLMGDRKIRTIKELSDATGITRKTLTRLYDDNGTAIEFETVIKLCDFFKCELGELLYIER